MKTNLFQSFGHFWVFQICWHIECSTFTASSFRIWNSSTGIPSPPLALFIVMLSKAYLTSHSRMSGSRWVIIMIIWVVKIFFVQVFCVFLPPLLLLLLLGQYHFCPLSNPSLHENQISAILFESTQSHSYKHILMLHSPLPNLQFRSHIILPSVWWLWVVGIIHSFMFRINFKKRFCRWDFTLGKFKHHCRGIESRNKNSFQGKLGHKCRSDTELTSIKTLLRKL